MPGSHWQTSKSMQSFYNCHVGAKGCQSYAKHGIRASDNDYIMNIYGRYVITYYLYAFIAAAECSL